MKIVVVGLGYVGTITAFAFAKEGFQVIGCEKDLSKINLLNEGKPHFYEPNLEELIAEGKDNITFTTSLQDIDFDEINFTFICVGTPSGKNGRLNLSALYDTVETLGNLNSFKNNKNSTVVVRSTIESGTIDNLRMRLNLKDVHNEVLFHPEFLREGSAISDFKNPPFIVCSNPEDVVVKRNFTKLYESIDTVTFSEVENLELLKLSCNVWHALKVTFANEIGLIADKLGANGQKVMEIFSRDEILNISKAYLKPGFAFGGSCLPKDVSSLTQIANSLDLSLIPSINVSNNRIIEIMAQKVLKNVSPTINWIGITFKEKTDDTRDSPYLKCINYIADNSDVQINVYDPHLKSISKGRNRDVYISLLNHKQINIVEDLKYLDSAVDTYSSHKYSNMQLEGKFSSLTYL